MITGETQVMAEMRENYKPAISSPGGDIHKERRS